MYGDFFLVDGDHSPLRTASRLPLGETAGRNEAWLRDMLLAHPELLPVRDIDAGFGPLVPLCRELRTEAGPLDLAFINPSGRLTLVECKLWRNPEARRKVVAQALDYASAISRWSYSDLQRQVSQATGLHGNVPFDLVRALHPQIVESQFVDAAARSLKAGRFLLLIAGDGIREDVESLAEYINRNTASDFTLGLVEVAIYAFDDGTLAVQPRTIARTRTIDRMLVSRQGSVLAEADSESLLSKTLTTVETSKQAEYSDWWAPVIAAPLDDPDQDPPKLYWPNHVRVQLPWPQAWITAYRFGGPTGVIGVSTAGRKGSDQSMLKRLEPQMDSILETLPPGFEYRPTASGDGMAIQIIRPCSDFNSDSQMQTWAADMINQLVNALRPALKSAVIEAT